MKLPRTKLWTASFSYLLTRPANLLNLDPLKYSHTKMNGLIPSPCPTFIQGESVIEYFPCLCLCKRILLTEKLNKLLRQGGCLLFFFFGSNSIRISSLSFLLVCLSLWTLMNSHLLSLDWVREKEEKPLNPREGNKKQFQGDAFKLQTVCKRDRRALL